MPPSPPGRPTGSPATRFGATGRHVVNDVRATFRFSNGLIADHVDEFDFRRWARQALGIQGVLVALVPPLRAKVRSRARAQLEEFMASEPAPSPKVK